MPLTYVGGQHAEAGGIATSVTIPSEPSLLAGDLIVASVQAQENTRGWNAFVNNGGSASGYVDVFTDGTDYTPSGGRFQYLFDDGVNPRSWWWVGYRIASVADQGATQAFSCTAAPPFGVGVAGAYAVYRFPGSTGPLFSFAKTLGTRAAVGVTDTAPPTALPSGATGTYIFTLTSSSAFLISAASLAVFGDAGDFRVICIATGYGGSGLWIAPGSLVQRVQAGGAGGPWYMTTIADGPESGTATNLGRLPLLGAG